MSPSNITEDTFHRKVNLKETILIARKTRLKFNKKIKKKKRKKKNEKEKKEREKRKRKKKEKKEREKREVLSYLHLKINDSQLKADRSSSLIVRLQKVNSNLIPRKSYIHINT